MANISTDQLANEITKAFQEYTEDVTNAIERKVDDVANEMLMDIAMDAPFRTGKYRRGLKVSKKDEYGSTKRIIWNKKYYRLVHLLEKGHVNRDGTRAKEFPHFRPAYKKHGMALPDHIRRIIQNGGGE